MLAKRLIPCLDVRDGAVVKGINFEGLRSVGDPVELGERYAAQGADELVYLDISASREGRETFLETVAKVASTLDIPFTVGGGIRSLEGAAALLDAGADKVSLNTAAVQDPGLIGRLASRYGNQFVVVAVDARRTPGGTWTVTTHGGSRPTGRELFSWIHEAQERGAGEILLTSMDHDGTCAGYPVDLFAELSGQLRIPVIASGGAGSLEDIAAVLSEGGADAALAASIFHYGQYTVADVKRYLIGRGVPVRPPLGPA